MDIHIYDTKLRSKVLFEPMDPNNVLVYLCGPTVYGHIHIGNAFSSVVFDVFVRLLRARFPNVKFVKNITDVDDKINQAALENDTSITEWAHRFTDAYHEDIYALGVLPPDVEPKATEHIALIQTLVTSLIDRGFAYEAEGHVLFHVPANENYGELSQQSLEAILDGARVEVAPYKKDPKDFVLWKPSTDELPGWDSPWGRGRPGWHIECTAMIHQHLGTTIDIHGAGSDLMFPHNENELAQGTCVMDDSKFVRHWMHNGMLNMGSEKMSKSLGNIISVYDLRQNHPGETIRYALLTGHYRQSLSWDDRLLEQSQRSLDSLYRAVRHAEETAGVSLGNSTQFRDATLSEGSDAVISALADDLHTPRALAAMHELASEIVSNDDSEKLEAQCKELLHGGWLLGILTSDQNDYFQSSSEIDEEEILRLIDARKDARSARDFTLADSIRKDLLSMGVELEDTREGTRWSLVKSHEPKNDN